MSNSPLVDCAVLSPHCSSPRNHKIDTITVHHMAGNLSVETCGQVFRKRQASANYGVDSGGRVGLYVQESDRSWASASPENDHRAVTIEVANCADGPDWPVSEAAWAKLVELTADICRRNGIEKLVWSGDRADRVAHRNGSNMTVHRDFMATACPGPYLMGRMPRLAVEVNAALAVPAPELKVGSIVEFRGTRHYASSNGTTPSACRPGQAKLTALAPGARHPYHIIGTAPGTVYGWVDREDI